MVSIARRVGRLSKNLQNHRREHTTFRRILQNRYFRSSPPVALIGPKTLLPFDARNAVPSGARSPPIFRARPTKSNARDRFVRHSWTRQSAVGADCTFRLRLSNESASSRWTQGVPLSRVHRERGSGVARAIRFSVDTASIPRAARLSRRPQRRIRPSQRPSRLGAFEESSKRLSRGLRLQ